MTTDRKVVATGLGLAMLLVAGFADTAGAEVKHTTEYRANRVAGATPSAIWRAMNANPIIDPDDGPAYANLTHDHDLAIRTAPGDGRCGVTDLNFRWHFVITLPKAIDYVRMSAATRRMWNEFVAELKRHEEGHRTIFLGCGKRFIAAAARLTGPANCAALKEKVRRFVDKHYAACMVEQRQFEARDRPRVMGTAFIRSATGR